MVPKNYSLKKRVFTLLVMLLTMTSAAIAQVYIGGKTLSESKTYNASDYGAYGWKSGSVTWDANSKTLTLNNFSVESSGSIGLEISMGHNSEVKINVKGTCRIKSSYQAISEDCHVTIDGDSDAKLFLEAETGYAGERKAIFNIYTEITSSKRCITGKDPQILTLRVFNTLKLNCADEPIEKVVLYVGDGYGILSPHGAYCKDNKLYCNNEFVKGNVSIGAFESYGIKIAGTTIGSHNYDCIDENHIEGLIVKSGNISYNKDAGKLVLADNTVLGMKDVISLDAHQSSTVSTDIPLIENTDNFDLIFVVGDGVRFEQVNIAMKLLARTQMGGGTLYMYGESGTGDYYGNIEIGGNTWLDISATYMTCNTIRGVGEGGAMYLGKNATIVAKGAGDKPTSTKVKIGLMAGSSSVDYSPVKSPHVYLEKSNAGYPAICDGNGNPTRDEVTMTTKSVTVYNDVKVFGKPVTTLSEDDILDEHLKSGRIYFRYDMDGKKWLVFSDAKASYKDGLLVYSKADEIEFRINGKNQLDGSMAITYNTTLKALGNGGSLELTGGIEQAAGAMLTITSSNVSYSAKYLKGNKDGGLTIEVPITLKGGVSDGTLSGFRTITLKNGLQPYTDKWVLLVVKNGSVVGTDGKPYTGEIRFAKSTFNDLRLTVGDIDVTELNMFDVLGDGGSVTYDGVGTLTLKNANITGTDYALQAGVNKELTINVQGNCTLKRTSTDETKGSTVAVSANTFFVGSGTMNVTGSVKTYNDGPVTVSGPTINCTGGFYCGQQQNDLTVESGTINVKAYTVDGFRSLTLGEGVTIQKPKGGYYEGKYMKDANGKIVTSGGVIISSDQIVAPDVMPQDIFLNKVYCPMSAIGQTETLKATISPTNATDKTVKWSTSDESVATVVGGTVTAVGEGTCDITATAVNGVKISCMVLVNTTVLAQEVTLNKTELTLKMYDNYGDDEKLVATVSPSNTTNTELEWSTSDESVATVSTKGTVKAVGIGGCVVTCTAKDGSGRTATCNVYVKSYLDVSDYFDVEIGEGVRLDCHIIDRDNNYCEIPGDYDEEMWTNDPAIDEYTEGDIVIPMAPKGFKVISIGDYAFYNCSEVTSFTVPEGVESIGFSAFENCLNADFINLPSTLTHISDYAFLGCCKVKDVYLPALTPPTVDDNGMGGYSAFSFGKIYDEDGIEFVVPHVLHVPAASLKLYKELPWTWDFDKIVPIDPVEGDLDGDGEIGFGDAEAIADYLLGKGSIDIEAADIDGDGKITIADVTAIIQRIIGKE